MTAEALRTQFLSIKSKRDVLLRLREQADLGTLQLDVNQALEEMDDLIAEFERAFPSNS
jgi:hypothetical protein